MNILSIENLTKKTDDKLLFKDVTFGVDEGDKIGFISPNGAGKSTFLHILTGEIEFDSGTLSKNREITAGLLEQTPFIPDGITLKDFLFLGNSTVINLINRYYAYLEAYDHTPAGEKKLASLTEQMDKAHAWNVENTYRSLLNELHLPEPEHSMDTLSGGMKKKASLARILASQSTLLLLDEPTNHLDIETIEWLEEYLKDIPSGFIMVTHDRYFLDRVCSHIMELDRGKIYKYRGTYTTFLQRKNERLAVEQNEQTRIRAILRRELEWLKRGPRARAGKDKKRKAAIRDLQNSQIEREQESASFSSSNRRMGKKIIDLKAVTKSFDEKTIIASFSYRFNGGEKIGIIGPNGSGKSTFLNIVAGHLPPDAGFVDTGINTAVGYYDQLSKPLKQEVTVLEFINKTAERILLADGSDISSSQFLEMFSFPPGTHRLPVSMLSGGEKRRLLLISILAGNPNFLILDEPTNDLDIETMRKLEEYLIDFSGTLLIVSHDRAFLDRTTDSLFIFSGDGTIKGFSGNYSTYRENKTGRDTTVKKKKSAPYREKKSETKRKEQLTFKEKEELNRLFQDIDTLETEKNQLEKSFTDTSLSREDMARNASRYKEITRVIEEKTVRWEELAAFEQ